MHAYCNTLYQYLPNVPENRAAIEEVRRAPLWLLAHRLRRRIKRVEAPALHVYILLVKGVVAVGVQVHAVVGTGTGTLLFNRLAPEVFTCAGLALALHVKVVRLLHVILPALLLLPLLLLLLLALAVDGSRMLMRGCLLCSTPDITRRGRSPAAVLVVMPAAFCGAV